MVLFCRFGRAGLPPAAPTGARSEMGPEPEPATTGGMPRTGGGAGGGALGGGAVARNMSYRPAEGSRRAGLKPRRGGRGGGRSRQPSQCDVRVSTPCPALHASSTKLRAKSLTRSQISKLPLVSVYLPCRAPTST